MNEMQEYASIVWGQRRDEERRREEEEKLKLKSKSSLFSGGVDDVMDTAAGATAIGQSGARNSRCLGLTAR